MHYVTVTGYRPEAYPINASQAHLVARRFAGRSLAIKHFTNTRTIANLSEQLALISAIDRLFHSVPRGKGYCLDRAALANLHRYVMTFRVRTTTKRKEIAYV